MDNQQQEIEVNIEQEFTGVDYDRAEFEEIVKAVSSEFGIGSACINILVVGDAKIIEVNKQFLHSDSATDVISFDLSDETCDVKLFDIVVNAERAIRQAEERGHDSKAELALYIVHGLLHNLGFNDMTEEDAAMMHKMEDKILTKYGFGKVYNTEA
ncbi:MAG TPA: rRNA maturation RNase YbeY [Sedimentisphaerales bacterium]|nr:rRNA maturation RNase YbeY [Sedimentisphaerales bacterium]